MSCKLNVLLIEFDPENVSGIVELLANNQSLDCTVTIAAELSQIREAINTIHYDLIIIDSTTIQDEQHEEIEQLRENESSAIILITDHNEITMNNTSSSKTYSIQREELNETSMNQAIHQLVGCNESPNEVAGFNDSMSLFNAVSSLVFTVNLNGHIINSNCRAEEYLGYKESELVGKSLYDLVEEKSVNLVKTTFQELLDLPIQSSESSDIQLVTKEDVPLDTLFKVTAVHDEQGVLSGFICLFDDKTEEKALKAELRKEKLKTEENQSELDHLNKQLAMSIEGANLMAKQAHQANQTKSDFLANMSHEIRTPISGILGFGEVLVKEDLTDTQREYVQTIINCGQNLLHLINDILDFSKIEAGKLTIEITEMSLETLLNEINSFMRPMAQEKGIDFEIRHRTPIPAMIKSDSVRLRQCLINLISNAIKFTTEGHVYIDVSWNENLYESPLRFDVIDTGIGIPGEKINLIFDSFTQADSSTTRKYGGTGLGLAITKQLIELLKGQINVTSMENKGSTFSLTLPTGLKGTDVRLLGEETFQSFLSQSTNPDNAYHKYEGRILIAEDNIHNQKLLDILLKRAGLNATIVCNGKEALDLLREHYFDLVFMDMQMPVMNGYDASRAIRREQIDITIIALTAHAMQGDKEKCIEAGCDNYLCKPVNQDSLHLILEQYLKPVEGNNDSCVNNKPEEQEEIVSSVQFTSEPIVSNLAGDKDLEEVAQIFIDTFPEFLERMEKAIEKQNAEELACLGHELKGSGGSAGFDIIYEKARAIEFAAKDAELEMVKQLIEEIKEITPNLSAYPV